MLSLRSPVGSHHGSDCADVHAITGKSARDELTPAHFANHGKAVIRFDNEMRHAATKASFLSRPDIVGRIRGRR